MLKNRRKLSKQLSLGIMLMATPIFMLSLGVLYVQSRHLIHKEVTECCHSMLNTSLHRVRNYMGTIETSANSNAWMLEENFQPDSLKSVSNRIVRLNAPVISSSVFVVPGMFKEYGPLYSIYTINEGDTVATYFEPEFNYLDKAFYTRPVTTGNACWIDPYQDNAEWGVDHNKAVATYCRPLKQDGGRIVGVVTADLSFSQLAKMLNEVEHPYPNAYYMLLDREGRFLIHPDTTRLFRKTIFTDANPSEDMEVITLGHEMTAGKQGTIHITTDGALYHISYQPVKGTDWSLALVCPDSDAMQSFYNLGFVIIVLLIIGLIVIMILCNRVVRQTISPIHQLISTTQKIAEGHYDEAIPHTAGKSVIAQLQNSFADMQASLNERMGSLRKNADEIRQRNEDTERKNQKAEAHITKKNEFIQYMTRQMRMPLNVIAGFADVLSEKDVEISMTNTEELDSITDMMKSNATSLSRMVLMLLDASETDASGKLLCTKTDEVSCNKISQEVINHIQSHYPNVSIQFETELQDAIHILTNRNFLLCVLIEPLYNAVSHSDGKHISLHVSQTATTVRFTIQDVGPGLPEGLAEIIYEPFTKAEEMPRGIGLGLPLARRHAICLGGSMSFDTDYHEGCRIVVEMPK